VVAQSLVAGDTQPLGATQLTDHQPTSALRWPCGSQRSRGGSAVRWGWDPLASFDYGVPSGDQGLRDHLGMLLHLIKIGQGHFQSPTRPQRRSVSARRGFRRCPGRLRMKRQGVRL